MVWSQSTWKCISLSLCDGCVISVHCIHTYCKPSNSTLQKYPEFHSSSSVLFHNAWQHWSLEQTPIKGYNSTLNKSGLSHSLSLCLSFFLSPFLFKYSYRIWTLKDKHDNTVNMLPVSKQALTLLFIISMVHDCKLSALF